VVERGVLEKLNRYLVENSTKSLCQPEDSDNLCFLDCSVFARFARFLVGDRRPISPFTHKSAHVRGALRPA
jgi:hypothetical protein